MRLRTIIGLLVLLLAVDLAIGQVPLPAKQVVAPASDIESGLLKLPDPIELGVRSRTALLEIDPARADENGVIRFDLPMMIAQGRGRVVFLPQEPDEWVGVVTSIDADARRSLTIRTDEQTELAGVSRTKQPLPWGDAARLFDAITLPQRQGAMQIEIQLKKPIGGYALIDQSTDRELYSYVAQRRTLVGRPITLVNSLSDGSRIVTLRAVVRSPDGSRETIEANVGADRFSFTPKQPGKYSVQVIAEYADKNNMPVLLTTQHVIEVESPTTPLGGVRATVAGDQIELAFDDALANERTIVAAEVWGRNEEGMVPVCWLSRVCDAQRSLMLDPQLVLDAGVDPATIELRQVRVHDVDSLVPTQIVERVAGQVEPRMIEQALQSGTRHAPMRVLFNEATNTPRGTLPGGHRLLLVHGYCSGGNPFTASHYSGDIAQFSDPNVSRSHDAFALEILNQTAPMKSFGVAAHSQGAMAALHLYTFYFSGLDWARGDRLIQSVGAPYQGTALAGNAAVLGDIFGFGCGENTDMSYTGSANWLSLIPTSSRQQVWYYTTSFEDRPFAFDYCNIITDLLLSDPDDGVIERDRGQLPGATNMGHVEGWCHTTGMRDPAQCTDASRNATINARAKR